MWNHKVARAKLKEQGRTTDWLAKQCGLEVGSLRNILRGSMPSLPVIKLMALALECDEEDLAGTKSRRLQKAQ